MNAGVTDVRPAAVPFPAAKRFRRCESGVSAVEFALVAPILVFGLLATVDLGFALFERMSIDQALRAGAQSAMADQDASEVRRIIEASLPASSATSPPVIDAVRYDEACVVECSTPPQTFTFYRLSAEADSKSMLLPAIKLSSSLLVQVR